MSDFKHQNIYYDLTKLLSYNKLLNISIGSRGRGKSYAAKKWAINGFLKNKRQFVYLRRYKTEFNNINNYFSDIADRYPNHNFEVKNGCFLIDNEVAGYYISLSTSQQNKSNSYPDVDKIIFDEFIIDKGKVTYLKGEVQLFLDMIETIARTRDDVRILMISNAISSVNPYFLYFGIYPHNGDKIICKQQVVVDIDKSDVFINYKKQTRFGQLIADTKYGRYSIDNEFLRDDVTFIQKMSGKSYFWYGLKYLDVIYSVWYNESSGYVFITKKDVPENSNIYAVTTDDHEINMLLLSRSNGIFKKLREAYDYGQVRFDCLQSKSAFYEMINYM